MLKFVLRLTSGVCVEPLHFVIGVRLLFTKYIIANMCHLCSFFAHTARLISVRIRITPALVELVQKVTLLILSVHRIHVLTQCKSNCDEHKF